MDPSRVKMSNLHNGLSEEANAEGKDLSKHLEGISTSTDTPNTVLKLRERDIDLLRHELDLTNEDAKRALIRSQGDVEKAIEEFLGDIKVL